jgi:uncharacterized membrane protein
MATATIWVPLAPSRVWPVVSDPTRFNQFMSHIRQVHPLGEAVWEWQLGGLLGIPIIWQARVNAETEERIVWESTKGPLRTKGWTVLKAQGEGSIITLHLEYHPPAGVLQDMFAELFPEPQKMLEEDLEKLRKILVEQL